MDNLKLEGIVTVKPFQEKDGKRIYMDSQIHKNLVTYNGRDLCAGRIGFGTTPWDVYINLIAVGESNVPAPTLADVELASIITSTAIPTGYNVIDTKELSITARGRIIFTHDFFGSDFDGTETVKEAGLFVVTYAAPTTPADKDGDDWMFSRVAFPDPGFTVFPVSGGLAQGIRLIWAVNF